ncbi:4-alpha-glucanotransferase [Sphingomonas yantingensis]|uniref:4-alpha-glucanotransferase n=1 Tax=Sphingomonas yantingensis TaxID=1241761 RepID=A0A7W9ASW0_9SPHN|nr:4-alpha-glucanotransferase [Sphingomonas yantingensis]MBB5699754.1 4-alpha-glucanotransferase [Sphingomonas yantingensis]
MSDDAVRQLAEAAGVLIDWEDADGQPQRVSVESLRAVLSGLGLDCDSAGQCADSLARLRADTAETCRVVDAGTPLTGFEGPARLILESGSVIDVRPGSPVQAIGYHRLEHRGGEIELIVAPPRGAALDAGERLWGTAVQLYSLRGDGAIGDFAALADFAGEAARAGADALMLSPVHALFTADPGRYSPYSPSSRRFLNPWYAPVDAPDPGGDLIDWPSAVDARMAALRREFAKPDPAFDQYRAEAGDDLRRHALFEALFTHFGKRGWQDWPATYHDPDGDAVTAFAREHEAEIDFHLYAQWRAETALARAAEAAGAMRIGLVTDIAVGIDVGGSHAWTAGDELMLGIGIGAPPDAFQAAGQNWGITSFSPVALKAKHYRPFIDLLRSAMAHAGGIRIDHALGLRRLWVVPNGASPLDGAYLRQPEDALLRLIALESARAKAIVIGEDLGVVPPGLREALTDRGILGMRVLPFERTKDGGFVAAADYDADVVAMTSTHDLAPVAGWWRGTDLQWRADLAGKEPDLEGRATEREAFWRAATDGGVADGALPDTPDPAVDAAAAFVAATPAALAIVPVEDLLGLDQAPNLPGTVDEHPNWRRRLPAPAADLFARLDVAARIDRIKKERRR